MKKIKFSAADWSYVAKSGLTPEKYYSELRKIGYEAVEMTSPANMKAARDAGLQIINMGAPGMTKGLNRLENHAELLPQIRNTISEAKKEKIPYVIIFSGNREGQPDAEGIKNCITGIEKVIGDASKAGVTLIFEMLNSFEHADYQADNSAYGFTIAKKFNSPSLKVLYDIYHMERMGEDSVKDIVGNLGLVAHIHVAESPKRTIPLPDGKIRYREIVKKVSDAGYSGFWGMEFLPGADVLGELKTAAQDFSSFVK
ncbi:MAG: sugar phosphate isomerase/epimerase family protein [Victivallales bacterium]|jgi:hydroxypyruvate isomerase